VGAVEQRHAVEEEKAIHERCLFRTESKERN
jgi:hypothetical protein